MKCGHAGVLFRSRDNVVRGSNHLFQVIWGARRLLPTNRNRRQTHGEFRTGRVAHFCCAQVPSTPNLSLGRGFLMSGQAARKGVNLGLDFGGKCADNKAINTRN